MHYYFRGYRGSSVGKKINGSYQFFDGIKIKTIGAKEGKTIVINFTSEVQEGELTISILDSSNDLVANLETNTTGIKEINGSFSLQVGNPTLL
jgi:hypothetical protein